MAPTLVDSGSVGFADGGAGRVFDMGSPPSAGDWDVLTINSDTVVTAVSDGFTKVDAASNVGNQGAYTYVRQAVGGEGSTVTVTTNGNWPAALTWSRWSGADAMDVATIGIVNGSSGSATPAVNTGPLAATDELVVAVAMIHGFNGSGTPSAPTWSAGYTDVQTAANGSGLAAAAAFLAYKAGAGPAAEAPSVTWSGPECLERYIAVLTFTPAGGPAPAQGSAAVDLDLAVAAAGRRDSAGAAGLGLAFDVAAGGRRYSAGATGIGLALALAGTGGRNSAGAADLGLVLTVAAAGRAPGGDRPAATTRHLAGPQRAVHRRR